MKHHKKGRVFGRVRKQRTALLRSLSRALILQERIKTTEAKAKELRPFIERLITLANKNSLFSRRLVAKRLGGESDAVVKLVETVAPKYADRSGGYTRITKLGASGSDARSEAIIEFV